MASRDRVWGNLTFVQLVFGYVLGRFLIVLFFSRLFPRRIFHGYALIEKRFGCASFSLRPHSHSALSLKASVSPHRLVVASHSHIRTPRGISRHRLTIVYT